MLDKLKNLYEAQKKMTQMKKELENVVVEHSTAAGKIKISLDGTQKILSLSIDADLIKEDKKSLLEKEIVSCVNQASEKVQQVAAQKLKSSLGDLNLPGF